MLFSRRRFVLFTALGGLFAFSGKLQASDEAAPSSFERSLQAWADTLFPADSESPGAGELNVHLQVIEKASALPDYSKLLRAGIRWADAQAAQFEGASFFQLNEADRVKVVMQAESLGLKAVPGLFFYHAEKDARQFYYGHAESWAGVGFPHTPQPIGFLDYSEEPV